MSVEHISVERISVERRYDLDWLRVIAFIVLIYFHAAIFFIDGGLPLIQNAEVSIVLTWFVETSHQFRLALLFMIAGAGVAFARRRRTNREFVIERSARLLLPCLVGVLLLVPPMVYVEKRFLGEVDAGYLAFLAERYFTEGVYPDGHLSWHHFWFIVYLYLFCLLGVYLFNLFRRLETSVPGRFARELDAIRQQPLQIYGFVVVLLVPELFLRAIFPGFRDLVSDWASFVHWFLLFLAGFTFATRPFLLDVAESIRQTSLLIALCSLAAMYVLIGSPDFDVPMHDPLLVQKYVLWCVLRMTFVWTVLLAAFGYAARYLQRGNTALSFLNEAVYPLFILHLTVLVMLGYVIVAMPWSLWMKYLVLTTTTLVIVLATYAVMIRPFNMMRRLFGVKPKPPRMSHLPTAS